MNAPGIQLQNIHFHWQSQCLFQQFNFELLAGQCTVILGKSGSGKTTLLRIIAGLTQPSAGAIVTSDNLTLHGRMAYLSQQDGLLPWLNVLENCLIGARLRANLQQHQKEQAKKLLNQVGLADALYKKPAELSGGMRQRAALVRTLLEGAPVVLLDEPFSALDAITRTELQDLSAELLHNKTVLLVTHDPLEAVRLGNSIYWMQGSPAATQLIFHLPGKTPRSRLSEEVLHWQAEIWQKLAETSANSLYV